MLFLNSFNDNSSDLEAKLREQIEAQAQAEGLAANAGLINESHQ